MLTDWDRQIIADLRNEADRMEAAINGHSDNSMVRLSIGDSRPELVSVIKARIASKRAEANEIEIG